MPGITTWQQVSFLSTLVISMILSIGLALTALSLMFSHAVRLIQGSLVSSSDFHIIEREPLRNK
jgi:hypothetical protein